MDNEKKPSISRSDAVSFRIPLQLMKEFEEDIRIVLGPLTMGIIAPERFLHDTLKDVRSDFDVVMTPRHI